MKPFSPSLALPGARMARLMGLWALVSRLYVYLSGFVAIFLMAANVSPARFGEYSMSARWAARCCSRATRPRCRPP